MGRVVIYTTVGCVFSTRLKKIFAHRSLPFSEVNVAHYPLALDELATLTNGNRTVPQVFFNNDHIGVRRLAFVCGGCGGGGRFLRSTRFSVCPRPRLVLTPGRVPPRSAHYLVAIIYM